MGLLRRERGDSSAQAVRGRARVVPTSTGNVGDGPDANVINLSAKAAATSSTTLVALSAEDGGPVVSTAQQVTAQLPNWLRYVMHDAGSNEAAAAELPAEIEVPVLIDAAERTIVSMDVAAAVAELEPLRAIGTREFREDEAPLAPVRSAIKLPGQAVRETKGLFSTWGRALSSLREPGADEPLDPDELEKQRRTAAMLRVQFERNPKQREQVRRSVLSSGPSMAADVRARAYPSHAFAAWVDFQETSGVITAAEAAALRESAGPAFRQEVPTRVAPLDARAGEEEGRSS